MASRELEPRALRWFTDLCRKRPHLRQCLGNAALGHVFDTTAVRSALSHGQTIRSRMMQTYQGEIPRAPTTHQLSDETFIMGWVRSASSGCYGGVTDYGCGITLKALSLMAIGLATTISSSLYRFTEVSRHCQGMLQGHRPAAALSPVRLNALRSDVYQCAQLGQ